MSDAENLIELARKRFEDFGEADEVLFAAVAAGNCAEYTDEEDKDKLENADSWTDKRIIKSSRIEWLCCDRQAKNLVTDKGIQVTGAKIEGETDLSFAEISFPLVFSKCVFTEELNIQYSTIKALNLSGSHTSSIWADGVRAERFIYLRDGLKAKGEVRVLGAVIGGDFDCTNGEFTNEDGAAISADSMKIARNVLLSNGFKAKGQVCFIGATIGGIFECNNSEFTNKAGEAILADGMKVGGNVFLRNGFKAEGKVCFSGATIGGNFECYNSEFTNNNSEAIFADGMKVEGDVFLCNGFKAEGKVCFSGATIGGDFKCFNSEFTNNDGEAIFADGMKVEGDVFLGNGFKVEGEVRLMVTTIGRDFNCTNAEFINEKGDAISADRMDVKGGVYLGDGFKAKGTVRFLGASIGGNFNCTNGEFINEKKNAISADRMYVKDDVHLNDGFKAKGRVSFAGASIGGNFNCLDSEFINEDGKAIYANRMDVKGGMYLSNGFKAKGEVSLLGTIIGRNFNCMQGEFINEGGIAISADGMKVGGHTFLREGFRAEGTISFVGATLGSVFGWTGVKLTENTKLDLRNTSVGVLYDDDDEDSWPKEGKLLLDGFTYNEIYDKSPKNAKSRIKWLNRQGKELFRSSPYEQLAKVFEKMGRREDAKKILIEKEKKLTRLGGFSPWGQLWRDVLGIIIGYGYRPWRALWFIVAIILIGTAVFGSGYKAGIIVPVERTTAAPKGDEQLQDGCSKFNAFVYSMDMFVPLVDLNIAKYWRPDANKSDILRYKKYCLLIRGDFIREYMWVHICLGWILTTLWVAGLTGLVRK